MALIQCFAHIIAQYSPVWHTNKQSVVYKTERLCIFVLCVVVSPRIFLVWTNFVFQSFPSHRKEFFFCPLSRSRCPCLASNFHFVLCIIWLWLQFCCCSLDSFFFCVLLLFLSSEDCGAIFPFCKVDVFFWNWKMQLFILRICLRVCDVYVWSDIYTHNVGSIGFCVTQNIISIGIVFIYSFDD